MADWKYDLSEWERSGGKDVAFAKLFLRSSRMMRLFCQEGVGTGGFQAEIGHYSVIATEPPARYATAFRKVFGHDLSPHPDISHYVPRKMFGHVYREEGEAMAQDIGGSPEVKPRTFAALYPIVPETWKPAVLWGWRRHAGVREGGAASEVLGDDPLEVAYAFLHYPLDVEPRAPEGILPLAWEAPTFGYYGFRNGWKGKDDFLAQVYLKARRVGGWNGPNAGTFRLMGLGHVWAHGPTDRNRSRWEESIVMLPEDTINGSACARLTHYEAAKGGSGVVSFDLGDVYAGRKGRERLYEYYGGARRDSAFVDTGIRGMRSIAVDYSGLSGAPCLMVLADRIEGGGPKVWVWQLGKATKKGKGGPANDVPNTTVEGNTFTIRKGDATLHGTFVAPSGVRLKAEVRRTTMIGGGGSTAGKVLERPIAGVFAEGGNEFLVVVTVQRGEAPPVKIQGDGTVAVGRRTVRFDGKKIVLGRGEEEPVLDGAAWKITFPAKGPKGNALEISNPEFSTYLKRPEGFPEDLRRFFHRSKEGLVFVTEYTGVTTSSRTKYSRTELREMSGGDDHDWTLDKGGRLTCKLKIADLEGGANKIIFMQIHGKAPESKPLLKCIWEKGRLRLLTKGGKGLKDIRKKQSYVEIPPHQWFTCAIRVNRKALEIQIDGKTIETYTADEVLDFWPDGNTYYFKAGNYLQHDKPGTKATVVFASIDVSHP
jgi:hypothetical protein